MIRIALVLLWLSASAAVAQAGTTCALVADAASGTVVHQSGSDCDRRMGPASSFKVLLSLIGFDAGIFTSESEPAWSYKADYGPIRDGQGGTMTPRSWLRESPVWYSRLLTAQLGMPAFAGYVARLGYGNGDVSGADGLTHSWLNRSLQVSSIEQIQFVRRLLAGMLPVTPQAMAETIAIMPRFPLANGWTAFGKTGTGYLRNGDGSFSNRQFGWFVGWAEKAGSRYAFVHLIEDEDRQSVPGGFRARDGLLEILEGVLP